MLEGMKNRSNKKTTMNSYMKTWRKFNEFIIRLDVIPATWEERVVLYCVYLIDRGIKSSTIKSYISGIKCILRCDDYEWNDDTALLTTLTKSCRLENDRVKTRLPIRQCLLNVFLFELQRQLDNQRYLLVAYRCIFTLAYYGLMRISELVGIHAIKANHVHAGENKDKLLIVLYSSKTHGKESRPQQIKINAVSERPDKIRYKDCFCPVDALNDYSEIRPQYVNDSENFFILQDYSSITPNMTRNIFKKILTSLDLDVKLYGTHSFRIGRASDLRKSGAEIETIKQLGRWKSNAVYKYLRS